jgi:hypothetical protein
MHQMSTCNINHKYNRAVDSSAVSTRPDRLIIEARQRLWSTRHAAPSVAASYPYSHGVGAFHDRECELGGESNVDNGMRTV